MHKISVIIPVYNVEPYLKECLESVLNQSYRNLEIICVDDCGTDYSMQIAEEYAKKDERIKIIHHETNKGLAISRNTGINNATGEYIFFLDSDDYILPEALEKMYECSIDTKSDIIISQVEAFVDKQFGNSTNLVNEFNKYFNGYKPDQYQITLENYIDTEIKLPSVAWGKLYKREFLLKNHLKFIEKNVMHEDEGFWLKTCSCFPAIAIIKEKGIMYRVRSNSIMASKKRNKSRKHFKLNIYDAFNYFDTYRTEYSVLLKNQIKNNECFCSHFDKKFGFLYRQRWLKNNKLISILGIPFYREKIEKKNKIIRILGIPISFLLKKSINIQLINIAFAINKKFVDKLCVCLTSILENNKNVPIKFYIMHSDLIESDKDIILKLKNLYKNVDFFFITINQDIFKNLKTTIDYISKETYYRYLLSDLIEEDKCLYLDADIIVNGNIKKFYETDISDYLCAGVKDLYIQRINYTPKIGLKNKLYINAGVILFNLKKIRQEGYVQKLLENSMLLQDNIEFQDQDILNITFKDKIKEINSIYNFCSENVYAEKIKRKFAKIIHFTGPIKPWKEQYKGKYKKLWEKYSNHYSKIVNCNRERL